MDELLHFFNDLSENAATPVVAVVESNTYGELPPSEGWG